MTIGNRGAATSVRSERAMIDRVLDHDNLLRAWESVRNNARSRGGPGPAIAAYGADVFARLSALNEAVRSGRYRPGGLRSVDIPKPSGGVRTLEIPGVADRVLERAVAQVLVDEIDPELSPLCTAYRSGMGVEDAVGFVTESRDTGARWVARTDIENCFGSIDHGRLIDELEQRVDDPWLLELVSSLLKRRSKRPDRPPGRRPTGVPQGAPLSPLLVNMFLARLDRALFASGLFAVRYADDLAIPVRTEPDGREALVIVREEAGRLGLDLNRAKTSVESFRDGFTFLGVEIDERFPRTDNRQMDPGRTRAVYITAKGAHAGIRNGALRIKAGDRSMEIPIKTVGQIVTFGPVGLSGWLRSSLLYRGVDVVHLSAKGGYLGRLESSRPYRPDLVRRQYGLSGDDPLRLRIARSVAAGKLANQRALLMRRARSGSDDLGDRVDLLDKLRRKALHARSVDQLRGYEGTGAREYFGGLRHVLPRDTGFGGRKRRPSPDPVNATLSFGYAILLAGVVGACRIVGLDPGVGFLHAERRGRPALALDLMEEFRPTIVDTVVVECFRRRVLTGEDFTTHGDSCRIGIDGKRAFVAALETRFVTLFAHTAAGTRMSYRRALVFQARQIVHLLEGERSLYEPVRWR